MLCCILGCFGQFGSLRCASEFVTTTNCGLTLQIYIVLIILISAQVVTGGLIQSRYLDFMCLSQEFYVSCRGGFKSGSIVIVQ